MNDIERLAGVLNTMGYNDASVRIGVRMAEGSCLSLKMDISDLAEAWTEEREREVDPVIDALTAEEQASFGRVPHDLASWFTDWDKAVIAAVARRDGDDPYSVIMDAVGWLMEEFEQGHPRRKKTTPPRAELVTTLSADERAHLEQITEVALPIAPTGATPRSSGQPQRDTLFHAAWDWVRYQGLRGGALRSANHWLLELRRDVGVDTPIREITPAMIRRYLGPCRSKEGKARAEKALAVFRPFFDWCVEQRFLGASPVPTVWQENGAHHPVIGKRASREPQKPAPTPAPHDDQGDA